MSGGDPLEAARNIDQQQDDQGGVAIPPPQPVPVPVLRNLPKFDDYTQGLAGVLITEKSRLDRIREDLTDQMLTAGRVRDAELDAAKVSYDDRVTAAKLAYTDATGLLEAKANNAVQAQDGIKRALDALT